jgi:hypothetical protein
MLSETTQLKFESLLKQYPLSFVVPEAIAQELTKRGAMLHTQHESRVAARFQCSGAVIITCLDSPIALEPKQSTVRGIVRNISRSGMSVLAGQQYFPSQRLTLSLPISEAVVRVMRCNQVSRGCFDIGVRVDQYEWQE